MLDIAAPGIESVDLARVDIEAEDRHSGARELQRQRESDIAETDDGDGGQGRGLALERPARGGG